MVYSCSVSDFKAVRFLVCLVTEGDKELYKAYTANDMSCDAHVSQENFSVVTSALTHCFLIKNVLNEAHG